MKIPALLLLAVTVGSASLSAQSTITLGQNYAYAANLGWVDVRGDITVSPPPFGVVIGEYVCSGYAYGANVGWINFGSGTAANGVYYANTSAADFGVNQDGTGRLTGYAYGANIGWINFEGVFGNPTVDLLTGKFSGFAYSANCGWINLGDITAYVQTNIIRRGLSTAGDGIPDAWKILNFGSIGNPNAAANLDPDKDGRTNLQEYLDGTDPNAFTSNLQITSYTKVATNIGVTWTSVPNRFYAVETNPDLILPWVDSGLGTIIPSGGATTFRSFNDSNAQRFYRVKAFQTPLLQP